MIVIIAGAEEIQSVALDCSVDTELNAYPLPSQNTEIMPHILPLLCLLEMASAVGFTFLRDPGNPNFIALRCLDPSNVTCRNPEFFRDGEPFVLVDSQDVVEGVRWEVTRNREGSFQCAETLEGERSMAVAIVGKYMCALVIINFVPGEFLIFFK